MSVDFRATLQLPIFLSESDNVNSAKAEIVNLIV
jgi:hypothetical protein